MKWQIFKWFCWRLLVPNFTRCWSVILISQTPKVKQSSVKISLLIRENIINRRFCSFFFGWTSMVFRWNQSKRWNTSLSSSQHCWFQTCQLDRKFSLLSLRMVRHCMVWTKAMRTQQLLSYRRSNICSSSRCSSLYVEKFSLKCWKSVGNPISFKTMTLENDF